MEYEDYAPDSTNSFKSAKPTGMLTLVGDQRMVRGVRQEGVIKSCYNQIKGIRLAGGRRESGEERLVTAIKGKAKDFFTSRIYTGTYKIRLIDQFIRPRKISSMWPFENQTIGEGTSRGWSTRRRRGDV